jgi:hypothetical protein
MVTTAGADHSVTGRSAPGLYTSRVPYGACRAGDLSRRARRQRNVSAVMRLTSVTTSAGIPARRAAARMASGLGAS